MSGILFYAGGDGGGIQGEAMLLTGHRCFTAAIRPKTRLPLHEVTAIMDSGAFTDVKDDQRLTPAQSLDRQIRREREWRQFCKDKTLPGFVWRAQAFVSYDRLIDETWAGGARHKQRWTIKAADAAVEETVEAARYLASQRAVVAPRRLVLSCQGVDARQYHSCVLEVLRYATPNDWIGLGGWCILGRWKSWLPEFWRTLRLILPDIAAAHIGRVHLFGCIWPPALGGLLHLCDEFGITVSADSGGPVLNCTWKNKKKSGARERYWRDNVEWWRQHLGDLSSTKHYCAVPKLAPARQLELFEAIA